MKRNIPNQRLKQYASTFTTMHLKQYATKVSLTTTLFLTKIRTNNNALQCIQVNKCKEQ